MTVRFRILLVLTLGASAFGSAWSAGPTSEDPWVWYRADAGVVVENGEVTRWLDSSGNDNHLTNVSELVHGTPLHITLEPDVQCGSPAVRFGGGGVMVFDDPLALSDYTALWVKRVAPEPSAGLAGCIFASSDLNNGGNFLLWPISGSAGSVTNAIIAYYRFGTTTTVTNVGSPLDANGCGGSLGPYDAGLFNVFATVREGFVHNAWMDGDLKTLPANGAAPDGTCSCVNPNCDFSFQTTSWNLFRACQWGSAHPVEDILEVIVYDQALSPFQRMAIEDYLTAKWDIGAPSPDADSDGYTDPCDCAPDDPDINPGEAEICDAALIDHDCDGLPDARDFDLDGDGDGYIQAPCGGDCNDSDPAIHPGAPDLPGDGVDNDCDGVEGENSGTVTGAVFLAEDPYQTPLRGAQVTLNPISNPALASISCPVDSSGTYTCANVEPGDYQVEAVASWTDDGPPDPDGGGPLPQPAHYNGSLVEAPGRQSTVFSVGASQSVEVSPIVFPHPVVFVHGIWGGTCVVDNCVGPTAPPFGLCDENAKTWKIMYEDFVNDRKAIAFVASGLETCQVPDCTGQLIGRDCKIHEYNADRLLEYLEYADGKIGALVQDPTADVPFDIVSHSMGGLATRVMIAKNKAGGGKDAIDYVRKHVMLGTPNAGSVSATVGQLGLVAARVVGLQYLTLPYMWRFNYVYGQCTSNQQGNREIPFYYVSGDGNPPYEFLEPDPQDGVVARQSVVDCTITENGLANAAFRLLANLIEVPGAAYVWTNDSHNEIHDTQSTVDSVWDLLAAGIQPPSNPTCDQLECPNQTPGGPAPIEDKLQRSTDATALSGLSYIHLHTTDSSARSYFELTWDAGSFTLELRNPSGGLIDPAAAALDPNIDYFEDLGLDRPPRILYRIQDPAGGVWEMIVHAGTDLPVAGTPFRTQSTSAGPPTLEAGASASLVPSGGTVTLTAQLTESGLPVPNGTVGADIADREDNVTSVGLLDDGVSPDATADDGIYTGTYGPLSTGGIHRIVTIGQGIRQDFEPFVRTVFSNVDVESSGATLGGTYSDALIDQNGVPGAEYLAIDVEVVVTTSSQYLILGTLSDSLGAVIQDRTLDADVLAPGVHTLTLRFDGGAIVDHGVDGPYTLSEVTVIDADQNSVPADSAIDAHVTAPYTLSGFEGYDSDGDGVDDAGDNCVFVANDTQDETDGDGVGNACDNCPDDSNSGQDDDDDDGFGNACDLCPQTPDSFQADFDDDGLGDNCDPDADDDGTPDVNDCDPLDAAAWFVPVETSGLRILADKTTVQWDAQTATDGLSVTYDAVKGSLADLKARGDYSGAVCILGQGPSPQTTDGSDPAVGDGAYFLSRARTSCRVGSYGFTASGERAVSACP